MNADRTGYHRPVTDEHEHGGNDDAEARHRVEFRLWNPSASSVAKLIACGTRTGSDERTDVYLVGPDDSVNAKLRDSSLEVKRLVSTVGVLERWAPDPPIELPLTSEQLDGLLTDLGIPGNGNEQWGDSELLDPALAVSSASTGSAVPVRKRRQRYEIDGVRAEFTEATFSDETHQSVAVEGPDSEPVRRLIGELGLSGENQAMHNAAAGQVSQITS